MDDIEAQINAALALMFESGHLDAGVAIHQALQTQQGRRAAGLPKRGRGKVNNADRVMVSDPVFTDAMRYAAGLISLETLEFAAMAHLGENVDSRTLRKFLKDLAPRAEKTAKVLMSSGWSGHTK